MGKTQSKKKINITQNFIIVLITIFLVFIEALMTIISSIQKGIFKKEILTKKSDLGFDISISIKK